MFPVVDKTIKVANDSEGNSQGGIDLSLETKLGNLQIECFNRLLDLTKKIAEENGIGSINSVMSIQVRFLYNVLLASCFKQRLFVYLVALEIAVEMQLN